MAIQRMTGATSLGRIISGTVLIALVTLLVRTASFGREILMGAVFGVGDTLDLFLVSFLVPSFFIFSIAACAGPSLIPMLMTARQEGGDAAVQMVIRRVNGMALLGFAGIAVLVACIAPLWAPLLLTHLRPDQTVLAEIWLVLLSMLIPVYGLAALWTAIANAHGYVAIPALAPVISPLVTIIMLLTLAEHYGAWAMVSGLMLGGVLELAVLGVLLHHKRVMVAPLFSCAREKKFEQPFAASFSGSAIANLIPLASQAIAAMTGAGGITQLIYGGRLTSLIFSVGALALGYSALPVFSGLAAQEDWRAMRALAARAVALTLAISIPLCLLLALFSKPIVQTVYQHGNFTAADVLPVARVQSIYLLQIPFALCWILLSSVLAAMHRQSLLLALAVFSAVLNAGLIWLLLDDFGVPGIAAATSMAICVLFVVASTVTFRSLNKKTHAVQDGPKTGLDFELAPQAPGARASSPISDAMQYPLVSLGLPVRNGQDYIGQAIDSVLAQTYPNLELVISDNCSSDRTQEICRSYAQRCPWVRYHRQQVDLGAVGNFEWLAQHARGDYFMWIAHDDTRSPDTVAEFVSGLRRHPDAVIIYGETVELLTDGSRAQSAFDCDTRGLELFARLRKTAQPQFFQTYGLWRTSALRRLYFGATTWGQEVPLMLAAASLGEVVQIKGPVLYYRVNPKPFWKLRASRDDVLPWGKLIKKLPHGLQAFAPRFAFTRLVYTTWRSVGRVSGMAAGLYAALLILGWLARQIFWWISRRLFPQRKFHA